MDIHSIKNTLSKFEFHDLLLNSIRFDLENKQLELLVTPYNEDLKDYDYYIVKFIECSELQEDCIIDLAMDEIYDLDLSKQDNLIQTSIIFLTGFGKRSLQWDFKCQNILLVKQ